MTIDADGDPVRLPVELVDVEGATAGRHALLRTALGLDQMIEQLGVQRRVDAVRLGSDLLHDVDFAIVGPFLHLNWKHPDRWPCAARAGQLRADFIEAVLPSCAFREDPGRRIFLPAPIRKALGIELLVPRLDRE